MEGISTDAKVVFGIIFLALIFGGPHSGADTAAATSKRVSATPAPQATVRPDRSEVDDDAYSLYRSTHSDSQANGAYTGGYDIYN